MKVTEDLGPSHLDANEIVQKLAQRIENLDSLIVESQKRLEMASARGTHRHMMAAIDYHGLTERRLALALFLVSITSKGAAAPA